MLSELGVCVRETRLAAGVSQRELARRTGISHPHLVNIEHGRIDPSFSVLAQLAAGLDLRPDELLARLS